MEINLAAIIFLMKTQFTGRRFRHHITLIIVAVSDDMNANFNISLGPLCSLSPRRIVGVLLLNRFDSPQKTNMSPATQHAQHTRLLSQSRHAALGWHGKHHTHVYTCETSEEEESCHKWNVRTKADMIHPYICERAPWQEGSVKEKV